MVDFALLNFNLILMQHKLLLFWCMVLLAMPAFAQKTVTGTITEGGSGKPMPGVSIIVKGTTFGAFTNAEGMYSVQVPEEARSLVISFVGYQVIEVPITGNLINITLEEDIISMDEVIITGYGSTIKRELTGNIAKVSSKDINFQPVTSVEQTLQGRAAGVFVESNNGKLGAPIRVRIRGNSSIGASNEPLYIVDGIILNPGGLNDPTSVPVNPLADLNFNDVASVEILKDASASAIYGARAANGVVIITTKRGTAGKTNFNFNYQTGSSVPTNKRGFLDREQYLELFSRAAVGAGKYEWREFGTDYYDDEEQAIAENIAFAEGRFRRYSGFDNDWATSGVNTNWEDQVFRRGAMQQADFSAAGGSAQTRFFTSFSWNKQEGMIIGNALERLSGRLNLDHQVGSKVSIGLSMALSRTVNNQLSDDNAFSTPMQTVALAPLTPIRDENGDLYDRPVTTYYNPLLEIEGTTRSVTTLRNLTKGYATYTILPGLTARGEVGIDLLNLNDDKYYGSKTEVGIPVGGYGVSRWASNTNLITTGLLNYDKSFDSHNLLVTAGAEYQKSRTDATQVEGQGFPLDDLKKLASAATITSGTSSLTWYSFVSYFARVNYNFSRKYLVSLSGRYDGSSRFGENNKFGFFPSASVGWVLSEEPFLAGSNVISFAKLRASFGLTGNAEIGNFASRGLYGAGSYANTSALFPSQIPNPNLGWERSSQFDVGIDFGIFNDRITGEIDYYRKLTNDLLLDVPVPGTSGFTTQIQNIGSMQNQGFELVLTSNNLTGDFKWTTTFNMAINRNKVLSLNEGQDIITAGSSRYMNTVKVGEPLGVFYGAEYAGVDQANGDAIWYVNALDSVGNVMDETATTNNFNDANFVVIGDPNPDLIGGLTNTFGYKGVELSVLIQGVYGNQVHDAAGGFMSCNACWFDNQTLDQMNYWDQPGDVTRVPEPRLGYSNGDQSVSGRYVYDASYTRVKNISLGYTFPKEWTSKAGISSLKIFATAQNYFTFTKYPGWDPEVTTDFLSSNVTFGVDFYAAPQPKTLVFGANLGF